MPQRGSDKASRITRRKDAVRRISAKASARPVVRGRRLRGLAQFLAESPLAGSGINLERTRDYVREIGL